MNKILYVVSIIFLLSCNSENIVENKSVSESTKNIEKNIVSFSQEQVQVADIKTGAIDTVLMSQEIYSTGVVEPSPQNIAKVSVPSQAFINEVFVQHGSFVNKGTTVLSFKHNDFIDLQANYLKINNELELKKEEYERQEKLFNEKAVSKKKFNQVKFDYNIAKTEKNTLKQKLILLGVDPDKLNAENISSVIDLKAPITGYIDEIFVHNGEFVEPKDVLFEMINPTNFNIMLSVYAKYKNMIKKGDLVQFRPCDNCKPLYAKIYSIGQLIDNKTKTFKIHAKPKSNSDELTAGSFINAKILIKGAKVSAIPNRAVINNQEGSFVFIDKGNNKFELVKIEVLQTNDKYSQIKNTDKLKNSKIIIEGANYLYAKLTE